MVAVTVLAYLTVHGLTNYFTFICIFHDLCAGARLVIPAFVFSSVLDS